MYTVNGLIIIIICNVTIGEPPFIITWYRNEEVVNHLVGNVSTVTVTDAEDDDVFTCKVDGIRMGSDQQDTIIRFPNNTFCVHTVRNS